MRRTERHPEIRAGGFTRYDGSVEFYLRIRALLRTLGPDPIVLDFGAGRGVMSDSPVAIHRELLDLRAAAGQVIGIDVDPEVLKNPVLTSARVIAETESLPVGDASIDLVVADHVFEHLRDPASVAAELRRVVRVGGWICARTPNRWGYIAIASRLIPSRMHTTVLSRVQPGRLERDVFPTVYRLNTRRAIAEHFPEPGFEQIVFGWEPEPAYVGTSRSGHLIMSAFGRITPEAFRPIMLVFLRRREPCAAAPSD